MLMKFLSWCPGWSAVGQSRLTATSASQVQRWGFSMLVRLVSNSRPQVTGPPQPPKVLGLQVLTLLPKLECSGMITAHCSLDCLSGKTGFLCIAQAGLELLDSNGVPALASQNAGIAAVSHRT
ncbi:hypothetical protein AAY473_001236 [Plecturocebus cupreus]